jgi:hypothetical protein
MNYHNVLTQTKGNPLTTKSSYGFVSTQELLSQLATRGWVVSKVQVTNTKNPDKQGFQRHLIRLRNDAFSHLFPQDQGFFELVLINSHDGSSSLRLMAGLYRLVCANGLIVGDTASELRVVHSSKFIKDLHDKVAAFEHGLPLVAERINKMRTITLNVNQYQVLKETCSQFALRNTRDVKSINFDSIAKVARIGDVSQDAFTIANRIQEKLIRGGLRYTQAMTKGDITWHENRTTRPVTSIDESVKRNRFVWSALESILESIA